MTLDINKSSFGGRVVVTCNTCHQGQTVPQSVPLIGQGAFTNTTRAETDAPTPASLPTVDEILERYVQALGGRAEWEKIRTRISKVTLLRSKLINSGTPNAAVINRGETWNLEIYQQAPDKYSAVITSPGGVIYQGYDGAVGWVKTPDGQRELGKEETARLKRQADLYGELNLKSRYSGMSVVGKENVGSHVAFVIEALSTEGRTARLFFDTRTGYLLRKIVLMETVLGADPEQTDYEDYRRVDGVTLPFTVRVSYLDDNHFGTTRTYTTVRHNVPVDDARFKMPVAPKP
jgi:hypothetical protein